MNYFFSETALVNLVPEALPLLRMRVWPRTPIVAEDDFELLFYLLRTGMTSVHR